MTDAEVRLRAALRRELDEVSPSPDLQRRILSTVWQRRRRRRKAVTYPITVVCVAAIAAFVAPVAYHAVRDNAFVGSSGSCSFQSPAQRYSDSATVFVGTFLSGPSVHYNGHSVLVSPARMRVDRYIKGRGPAEVRIQTGIYNRSLFGFAVGEDQLLPSAGQHWKIFASPGRGTIDSGCVGDYQVRAIR